MPIGRSELSGVWFLEEVYGQSPGDEYVGMQLIRFSPDGTYVLDLDGKLFSGDQAVWGRYRLEGTLLTFEAEGGWFRCEPGERSSWRVMLAPDNRLRMAFVRGGCPNEPQGVWFMRRVLLDVGLPARAPGVAPRHP